MPEQRSPYLLVSRMVHPGIEERLVWFLEEGAEVEVVALELCGLLSGRVEGR